MRAKNKETWFSPFDPSEVNFNYTEANAWQYSFYVPQDISGLMELQGGKKNLLLNSTQCSLPLPKLPAATRLISQGMIGQYAHGMNQATTWHTFMISPGSPGKPRNLFTGSATNFIKITRMVYAEMRIADRCRPGMCLVRWGFTRLLLLPEFTPLALHFSQKP